MPFIRLVAAGIMLTTSFSTAATAAEYPAKPISIVVPFPAGSTSDLIPRLLAPIVGKALGQTVVVENLPGANGSLGAMRVAGSQPDGYTLLMATTGVLTINPWIYSKLKYSPTKDFEPVINAAVTPNLIVATPSLAASDLKSVVALARKEPGRLTFASAGNGSTSHLCGESLKASAGIDVVHVPYQGPAPAMQDVLAGRVTMMCDNLSNVIQYVNAGKLKAIALTAAEHSKQAPSIPTVVDAGYPDVLAGNWYSFVAPAGTPRPIIDKLNAEFAKALHDPKITQRLESLGMSIIADTPDHFRSVIAKDLEHYKQVVKTAGARVD